jgi:hypothetical protein
MRVYFYRYDKDRDGRTRPSKRRSAAGLALDHKGGYCRAMLASAGASPGLGVGVIVVLALGCYFLPTIVATARKVPNVGSVFVINLFLGWTLIGWVVALAMAARSRPR